MSYRATSVEDEQFLADDDEAEDEEEAVEELAAVEVDEDELRRSDFFDISYCISSCLRQKQVNNKHKLKNTKNSKKKWLEKL